MLLLEIRTTSINYAKRKKREDSLIIQKLEEDIKILENTVDGDDELECKKKELEAYRKNIMDGVIIRSRAQWIKEGEKVTKYFCNLEKRRFTSKRMSVLINSSNNEITDSKEICKEVKNFYQSLYSSRENQLIDVDLDQLLNRDTPKIPDADKERMEMQNVVTMEEAGKVLNNMKNDKSPGSDGFSVNFFKFFWKDLGVYLVRSINYGLKAGKLSTTQTQGLITCIPKGQKSKKYLKNWRPITLLNVTYKIASSCIGNRIRKVLPTIISCDQSGFMSDRFVGDNIRLMYDILNYAKVTKKVGIVLLIDFEKAFDSLAWSFLFKTMHFL